MQFEFWTGIHWHYEILTATDYAHLASTKTMLRLCATSWLELQQLYFCWCSIVPIYKAYTTASIPKVYHFSSDVIFYQTIVTAVWVFNVLWNQYTILEQQKLFWCVILYMQKHFCWSGRNENRRCDPITQPTSYISKTQRTIFEIFDKWKLDENTTFNLHIKEFFLFQYNFTILNFKCCIDKSTVIYRCVK